MNRLSHEKSPYLKQHQSNPVDWYPWSSEALSRARAENKPILLSVGYSACHWCHVMAHESFENEATAGLMNELFINIKVDREERPDLDMIYQPVAQIMTRGGGWPLTVFLTPDLRPFYGGTYFPPEDRYGRPSFQKVLRSVSKLYQSGSDDVDARAKQIVQFIQTHEEFASDSGKDQQNQDTGSREILAEGLENLLANFDWERGGLGAAPKFPNVSALNFLWRSSLVPFFDEAQRRAARDAVLLSLTKMRQGGIFDQLGGGFHRYSVDESWSVPHFEKMLYDNALLLRIYGEVLAVDTKLQPFETYLFETAIDRTIQYLLREMRNDEGLFYAAQDADSEGVEGKYFVWSPEELKPLLSQEQFDVFTRAFGVTDAGNFEEGQTVLFEAIDPSGFNDPERVALIEAIKKVREARDERVKPGLDDKILPSWNGLLVSGLAWSILAFEKRKKYQKSDALRPVLKKMIEGLRRKEKRFLDDYAFFAQGLLESIRVFPESAEGTLSEIRSLIKTVMEEFGDGTGVGFHFTAKGDEKLIHRPRSIYDQAIPSGSGVLYQLMLVLSAVDGSHYPKVESDLKVFKRELSEEIFGLSEIGSAVLLEEVGPITVQAKTDAFFRMHPFYFFIGGSGPGTFCQRQACVLESKDLSTRPLPYWT